MRRTVALLCTAQFMVVLDATIVAVALPSIRAALDLGPAALEWVVSAYTLTFGGLLVPAGRIGDALGRRRTLRVGFALFTLASLACGIAPSAAVLLGARAVQGAGAALVAPAALALLNDVVGLGPARGRALAAWTAAAAGGGASGWVLGGLLASGPGWRWVFLANLPIGVAVTALANRLLPERRAPAGGGLGIANGAALTLALALLGLGLTRAQQAGPAAAWPPLLAALVAGAAFAALERRSSRPLLPARLLRSARFARAGGAALVLTATTTPAMFLAILYQHEVLGRGPLATGLGCMPFNLAVIAGSLLGPRVLKRLGERRAMAAGLAIVALGALVLGAAAAARSGGVGLLGSFALMGAGLGCASVASTAAGTAAPAAGDEGVTSGVLTAAAQVGTALGLAVLVTLAAARAASAGFVDGLQLAVLAIAGIALAAAAVLSSPPHGRRHARADRPRARRGRR
jgi:MFS family permease